MTPILISILNQTVETTVVKSDEEIPESLEGVRGIILSGGPACLSQDMSLIPYLSNLSSMERYPHVPVLGICFGMQLLTMLKGGCVESLPRRVASKDRVENVRIIRDCVIFKGLHNLSVFESHNDYVRVPPMGFQINAMNASTGIIEVISKDNIFAVQFHPEGTDDGRKVLGNFLEICK